jgi:small ligand-binding sensory domain FIST
VSPAGAGFSKGHLICTLPRDVLGAAVSTSLRDSGVVGLALSNCEIECLVSQGCRALGPTFEVRKVSGTNRNGILELEQVGIGSILSATGHLKSLMRYSTPTEQMLLDPSAGTLHVGFASSEFDEKVADDSLYAAMTLL